MACICSKLAPGMDNIPPWLVSVGAASTAAVRRNQLDEGSSTLRPLNLLLLYLIFVLSSLLFPRPIQVSRASCSCKLILHWPALYCARKWPHPRLWSSVLIIQTRSYLYLFAPTATPGCYCYCYLPPPPPARRNQESTGGKLSPSGGGCNFVQAPSRVCPPPAKKSSGPGMPLV